jgi:four helix bundle protein
VYRLTRKFPDEERFGLIPQMRRASVSVSSNIAEGCGRNSDKDFAHFLEQAYGSLMEVASQTYLGIDEEYVSAADADSLFEDLELTASKVAALNRSLRVSASKVKLPSTFDLRRSTLPKE